MEDRRWRTEDGRWRMDGTWPRSRALPGNPGAPGRARLRLASLAEPSELAVELAAAEDQRRGTPVRTVVGVIDQVPLGQQALDLFRAETLTGLNRRFAGQHVQQTVEQVAPGRVAPRLGDFFPRVPHDLRGVHAGPHH